MGKRRAAAETKRDRNQAKLVQSKPNSRSAASNTRLSGPDANKALEWRDVYASLPVVLALLTSLNTAYNGFVHDDLPQILNNPFTQDIANLPLAFTGSVWSVFSDNIRATMDVYYRPLFNILLIVNYALFGSSAWAWHLVNILIHAAVSFLIYIVIKEVSGRQWLSLITACLFAVHPAHAESVAWISGVTDPLMSLFFLSAFLFYLKYRNSGRVLILFASLTAYLLALLSKETASALPLVICFYEIVDDREVSFTKRMRRTLIVIAMFAIPTGLYFLLRYNAIGQLLMGTAHATYPLGNVLLTVPVIFAKYLWLMLVPFGYNFQHYTALVDSPAAIRFLGPLALLSGLTVAVVLIKSRMLKLGTVWFMAALAPAIVATRFLHPVSLVQERYLYLPSVGFCLVLGLGIEWLWMNHRNAMGRVLAPSLLLIIIAWWGWVTVEQNQTWRNTITLFQHCVAANPTSPLARTALSTAYHVNGKKLEAEGEARVALGLDPTCIDAYVNLAYFARSSGKLDNAIEYLQQGLSNISDDPEKSAYRGILHHDLGLLYEESKDFDAAEQNLLKALEYRASVPNIYDLGGFYFDRGQYEQARDLYEETFRKINPRFFGIIYLKLARTYDKLGQTEKARPAYEKYLELYPNAKDRNEVLRRLSQL